MTFSQAALTALYPVMAILGVVIWARFVPTLKHLDNGTRVLVCSNLLLVLGIVVEQIIFGFGRLTGRYLTIATDPMIVSIGKIIYVAGFSYMLYAFWLIAPAKPKIWIPFLLAFVIWACIAAALMF